MQESIEITNHSHLGQLITYASGHDAEIIIWIVKEFKDEHKKAVDWLNEYMDEKINLFLIKIELLKIGDSLPAPRFQIISAPNEWEKAIRTSLNQSEPTETKLIQLDFWNKFIEYAKSHNTRLRLRNPRPQHWYVISIGSSTAHISLTLSTRESILACEIYIPGEKRLFNELLTYKENIETEIGSPLEWMELPDKKASRIKLSKSIDMGDSEWWNNYFDWLLLTAEKFQNVFQKYIKQIGL